MSSALRKRTGCRCTVCPGLSCAVLCCPVLSLDSLDAQHSGALRPPLITLPQPAPSHAALHFPPLRTLRTPHPEPSSHAARTVCHPSSILVSGLAPSGVLSLKQYVTHRQNDPQRLQVVATAKHSPRDQRRASKHSRSTVAGCRGLASACPSPHHYPRTVSRPASTGFLPPCDGVGVAFPPSRSTFHLPHRACRPTTRLERLARPTYRLFPLFPRSLAACGCERVLTIID
jgi:hypothetical protein